VFGTPVTANYFSVLGAAAAAGRLFDAELAERPGADPVVVLSHRFCTRSFTRDPAVVGRTIGRNRQSFTVTGVPAQRFQRTGVRHRGRGAADARGGTALRDGRALGQESGTVAVRPAAAGGDAVVGRSGWRGRMGDGAGTDVGAGLAAAGATVPRQRFDRARRV